MEVVRLNSIQNGYRVKILVSTPPGGQTGGFELVVEDHVQGRR